MAQCLGNLWENCNKGLISDLILLGMADKHSFFQKKCRDVFHSNMFFSKRIGLPRFLATIANLPNNASVQNNVFFWAQ